MVTSIAIVLGLVCLGLVLTVVTQRRTALPDHADRGLRHDRATHAIALGAGLLAAVMAGLSAMEAPGMRGGLGIPLFMVLAAGLGYVAAQVVGQFLWPRPAGEHRRAGLTPRGPTDAASPLALRLLRVAVVVLAVAIAGPGLLAPLDGPTVGPQDIVRAGWDEPPGAVNVSRVVLGLGWPGLRYGVPASLAAGALLALTWLCLRLVAERPRVADSAEHVDTAMRRTAARRVLSAALGTTAFAGGWFALATGSRMAEVGSGTTLAGGLVLLVLGAMWATAGLLVAAVGILWPARPPTARPSAAQAGA